VTVRLPGVPGTVVLGAAVVADTDDDCAPVPVELYAATVNVYDVDADNPLTVTLADVDVATELAPPSSYTS
jgi:hypothetical protein